LNLLWLTEVIFDHTAKGNLGGFSLQGKK